MRGEIMSLRGTVIGIIVVVTTAIAISMIPKPDVAKNDAGTIKTPSDTELKNLELK